MIPGDIAELLRLGRVVRIQKAGEAYEVKDEILTYLLRKESEDKWKEVSFTEGEEFLQGVILYIEPEQAPAISKDHSHPIAV